MGFSLLITSNFEMLCSNNSFWFPPLFEKKRNFFCLYGATNYHGLLVTFLTMMMLGVAEEARLFAVTFLTVSRENTSF